MKRTAERQRMWEFMAELAELPLDEQQAKLSAFAREYDLPDAFAGAGAMRAGAVRGHVNNDAARTEGLRSLRESRITAVERRIAELEARVAELERKRK